MSRHMHHPACIHGLFVERWLNHEARPNVAKPTIAAGTRVTTRFPSGADHDTAAAVVKAAISPSTSGSLGLDCLSRRPCCIGCPLTPDLGRAAKRLRLE